VVVGNTVGERGEKSMSTEDIMILLAPGAVLWLGLMIALFVVHVNNIRRGC